MTDPRKTLISAIEAALPYSVRFGREKAETIVEAMEAMFARPWPWNELSIMLNSGLTAKDPNPTTAIVKDYKPPELDADVRELLDALYYRFPSELTHADFAAVGDVYWHKIQSAYKKLRARYGEWE